MSTPPLVSVVIPTRDRRRRVTRAIDSVRAQTYPHLEIIVVDDGSTDGTADELGRVPDVKLLRHETSIGGAAARNRGIAEARGEFVAFLDSDDEWLPDKVAKQVPLLLDSDRLGAVYCRHFNHDDETGVRGEPVVNLNRGDITEHLMSGRCPRTVSLFVVRRAALESVGGFDERLRGFQDTDLWIRMSAQWEFDAVDEPLAVVHNHGEARITTDIDARRAALDGFLAKWGTQMEARIGRAGVDRYRRDQLAVAQGSVVLALVRAGRRLEAFPALLRYLRLAGLSHPRQLAGLILATLAGGRAHARVKGAQQKAAR
jgi:glycosyltransferase involved in cell wall biosynthesis